MGAWGGGLYDGDFGLDLKASIKGAWRAPFSDDELLAEHAAWALARLDRRRRSVPLRQGSAR